MWKWGQLVGWFVLVQMVSTFTPVCFWVTKFSYWLSLVANLITQPHLGKELRSFFKKLVFWKKKESKWRWISLNADFIRTISDLLLRQISKRTCSILCDEMSLLLHSSLSEKKKCEDSAFLSLYRHFHGNKLPHSSGLINLTSPYAIFFRQQTFHLGCFILQEILNQILGHDLWGLSRPYFDVSGLLYHVESLEWSHNRAPFLAF